MPKITINQIELYYEDHGRGEPIVFIAGFAADHNTWQGMVDLLKHQYRLIVLDNRGVGQSGVPAGPYTVEQMAHDVASLCQYLQIEQAHFVGNSMGGFIVQMLAYRYPELIKSVVISNSTYAARGCYRIYADAQLELLQSQAPLAALIKASSAWVYSYQFLCQPDVLDRMIKIGLENPFPISIDGYRNQLAALDQFDSSHWIGKITAPALVIGGDQDIIFKEPLVKSLAEKLPNSTYFCFENCGHLPFIEYPDKCIQLVTQHINRVSLRSE